MSSATVRRFVSPVARKIAAEEGLDLSRIEAGSGPGGRIVKQDVLRLAKAPKPASVQAPPAAKPAEAPEKVKFVGWRKVIADRMISSAREVPQRRTLVEIDVTELSNLIQAVKKRIEAPKLTYLPFLMKAMQAGSRSPRRSMPTATRTGTWYSGPPHRDGRGSRGEAYRSRHQERSAKSILELAEDVQTLALKAREDRLKPEDVQGGTITITNLGPFDVYAAEPLILQPQTTIVAMGSVRDQPWVSNGAIEMRKKVIVTGVFDHRAVNGAPGARFLKRVKSCLEDLSNLLLWLR